MTRPTAMVLGAGGFLGSAVLAGLHRADFDVVGVKRSASSATSAERIKMLEAGTGIEVIETTTGVPDDLNGIDLLINALGAGNPASDPDSNTSIFQSQTEPLLAVLELARHQNVDTRIVNISSRTIFGTPAELPVRSDCPLSPQSVYAVAKASSDDLSRLFRARSWADTVSMRVSNPYGPHEHLGDRQTGLIGRYIQLASKGEGLQVFGDGAQKRDFIHVEDLVDAVRAIASHENPPSCVNVGGPEPVSIADAARVILEETGTGDLEFVPWPPHYKAVETGDFYFDAHETKDLIGWSPHLDLQNGIRATMRTEQIR